MKADVKSNTFSSLVTATMDPIVQIHFKKSIAPEFAAIESILGSGDVAKVLTPCNAERLDFSHCELVAN
jgi:hypothetical protein